LFHPRLITSTSRPTIYLGLNNAVIRAIDSYFYIFWGLKSLFGFSKSGRSRPFYLAPIHWLYEWVSGSTHWGVFVCEYPSRCNCRCCWRHKAIEMVIARKHAFMLQKVHYKAYLTVTRSW